MMKLNDKEKQMVERYRATVQELDLPKQEVEARVTKYAAGLVRYRETMFAGYTKHASGLHRRVG